MSPVVMIHKLPTRGDASWHKSRSPCTRSKPTQGNTLLATRASICGIGNVEPYQCDELEGGNRRRGQYCQEVIDRMLTKADQKRTPCKCGGTMVRYLSAPASRCPLGKWNAEPIT